ncbi:MAG TPA: Ig-like domain-containing protein [Anaerolineae bacterium]
MAFERSDKKNKPPAWRQVGGILAIMLFLLLLFGLATGVTAQTDDLIVTITEIDSQAFPQVVVSVAVSDDDGPVDDLTGANFQIFEDEVDVSTASFTLEPEVSQDMRLVLALDVSISGNDPAQIKSAAMALLDSLGLEDRVAVMTFGDEVELVHDFTNNHEELKSVIDGLKVGGSFTALHDVIIEALALADQAPSGRRAVIVITDSRDNVGSPSVDETVAEIRATQIPLSIIGFGNKVGSDQLRGELRPSGGRYVVLANSGQVQESLLQMLEQLRRGYQITFLSNAQADETEHNLSVVVNYQNAEAQADGRFVATRNPIVLDFPNLSDGQTVGGRIDLTPEIIAAASPTSVEYRLDGQLLATVDAAPFGFSWDSTAVEGGPHTLTVQAVDRVGNSGQTELNLKVVRPVEVAVSTAQTQVELGSEIDIQVEIETIEELAMVELLLDDRILASHTAPPFGFSVDSSQYPEGAHRITVRAEDRLGRQAQDELTMQFIAPPPPEPPFWQRWLAALWQSRFSQYLLAALRWGLAVLIILGVAIFGLVLVARSQKRLPRKIYPLEIANLGNAPSRYEL